MLQVIGQKCAAPASVICVCEELGLYKYVHRELHKVLCCMAGSHTLGDHSYHPSAFPNPSWRQSHMTEWQLYLKLLARSLPDPAPSLVVQ